jgi:hypothetical protein
MLSSKSLSGDASSSKRYCHITLPPLYSFLLNSKAYYKASQFESKQKIEQFSLDALLIGFIGPKLTPREEILLLPAD